MSETISAEIRLVWSRRGRGKFALSIMHGHAVLVAGVVDPHKLKEIDAFLQRASEAFECMPIDNLRVEILQLAASPEPRTESDAADERYFSNDDGLYWCKRVGEGSANIQLTNFGARIIADIVKDDGIEKHHIFEIEVELGERTFDFSIPAGQFNLMNWPTEHIGPGAIVFAGLGLKDHTRAAIQTLSAGCVERTIYTHTGWRKVGEQWLYLHAGGAIGANGTVEDVEVDLPDAMGYYVLPTPPTGDEQIEAVRASLAIIDLAPDEVTVPLLCCIYRAPSGHCDTSVFLIGPTGAMKSAVAALACQHFGPAMDGLHLPAHWSSTDNALEGLAFHAKDTLLVIDDFAPSGGQFDVQKFHQKAERVFRAQGNHGGRQRMCRDGTLRPPRPPRGSIISTGEDLPKGVSLRARMFAIEVGPETINVDRLSECQHAARSGALARAMSGFIRWIAPRYDGFMDAMPGHIAQCRAQATRSNLHARTPEAVANLHFGFFTFLQFAVSIGAVTPDESRALRRRCWTALGRVAQHQIAFQQASDPAQRFIDLVTSALTTGKAHLAARDGRAPQPQPSGCGWRHGSEGDWTAQGLRIGWIDGPSIYLDPDASFNAAQDMARGGEGISITAQMLRKRLDERGILIRESRRDELTTRRVLDGAPRHVLHLRRDALLVPPQPSISCDPSRNGGSAANNSSGNGRPARSPR